MITAVNHVKGVLVMNIGKQIKSLRLQRSITQEQLAQKLNVTSQAVCKWENGNTMPDITLLPEISELFGVTIDELFGLNEEVHFKRIDNLLRNKLEISDNDFAYAKDFLNSCDYTGHTAARLARLYNARANMYREKAKFHAENALKAEVKDDNNHSILCEAANGVGWDWNVTNHHELIDFYYEYIKNNQNDKMAYIYLMENLIADMRLNEAEVILSDYALFGKTCHYYRIKASIAFRRNRYEEAENYYDEMIKTYPEDWKAVAYYADFCAGIAQYDKALGLYERSAALQTKPRLLDNYFSIVHIYEIKGDFSRAIEAYEKIIRILTDEHGYDVNGDVICSYKRKIELLRRS